MFLKKEVIFMPTKIVAILTCIVMILMIILKPSLKFKHFNVDTFWIIALIGAIITFCVNPLKLGDVKSALTASSALNPLKIIAILFGLSFLSLNLDELGFFKYLALYATKKVNQSQTKLFFILYALISFLTIFTSNDIIILTFTLFICYFSRLTKINPIPYLVMEFVAANTYSLFLIIGNPTNIYLATNFDISFLSFLKTMALPTIAIGLTSILVLYLLFKKDLQKPFSNTLELNDIALTNKPLTIISIIHLLGCMILLAIANYIKLEMWVICLGIAFSQAIFTLIFDVVNKVRKKETNNHLLIIIKKLPFSLGIFVLSMYLIVLSLDRIYVFTNLSTFLNSLTCNSKFGYLLVYGISSFIACNIINNIPMSLAATPVLINVTEAYQNTSVFVTILSSNLGALLTPIGALAGIMWMRILKEQRINFSFFSFTKYGLVISPLLLAVGIGVLLLIL